MSDHTEFGDQVKITRGLYRGLVGILDKIRNGVATVRLQPLDLDSRHIAPPAWIVENDGLVLMGFDLSYVQLTNQGA